MDPFLFFSLMLLLTAAAAGAHAILHFRRQKKLRRLAALWHMHFAPGDQFRLSRRVLPNLPAAGAAAVRAWNVMYAADARRRGYLFTLEYGIGAIGSQRRLRRVALLQEPVAENADSHRASGDEVSHFTLAPEGLPLTEQYQWLHKEW